MKIEQIYTGCLAEASYYIESEGEAVIIDPLRETEPYLKKLQENKAKLKYVMETHFHADFVSGHVDLAKQTGAQIVFGPGAKTSYDIKETVDGEVFTVGKLKIKLLHTPGHTLESACFLLFDENGKEHSLYSGDTLFIGDVGRPDLAIKSDLTKEDLAAMLFDSLRNKVMTLPDAVIVYPAHGAGSACGKNMSKETFDTLGNQKNTNYALRANMTKEEFVKEVLSGILPPPQYFAKNAMMNKTGYDPIEEVLEKGTTALSLDKFVQEMENGALVLDTRHQQLYNKGFVPGSLNIGIDGSFAVWVGTLIKDLKQRLVLITDEGRENETVLRLARVGYDHAIGYLMGGFEAWKAAGKPVDSITSISAEELEEVLKNNPSAKVIDVRKPSEYEAEHVENAISFPLDFIHEHVNELPKNETLYMHCQSGYRSMLAASLLRANGYTNIIEIAGGFKAISATGISRTAFVCQSKK